MPEQSNKRKPRPRDFNRRAFQIVQEATGQVPKYDPNEPDLSQNPHAVALGQLGGLKGGPARARALSKRQPSEIAAKAAKARWGDSRKHK